MTFQFLGVRTLQDKQTHQQPKFPTKPADYGGLILHFPLRRQAVFIQAGRVALLGRYIGQPQVHPMPGLSTKFSVGSSGRMVSNVFLAPAQAGRTGGSFTQPAHLQTDRRQHGLFQGDPTISLDISLPPGLQE